MSSHNVSGVISSGVALKALFGQMITGLSQTVRTQDSDFTWECSVSNVLEITLCMSSAERRQTKVVIYHCYIVMTLYLKPCQYCIIRATICMFHVYYLLAAFRTPQYIRLFELHSININSSFKSRTRILPSAFHFDLLSSLSFLAAKTALSKPSYVDQPLSIRATNENLTNYFGN